MNEIIFRDESYTLIGLCMGVHRYLGMGFSEAIYRDALELEFRNNHIPFSREAKFAINYKGVELRHCYRADFIVFDNILLEIKSSPLIINKFVAQTLNYLKCSGLRLGIICNFGEPSFTYKRVIH